MGEYQELAKRNVLKPIEKHIDAGVMRVHYDNTVTAETVPKRHTPFIMVEHPWDRNCSKWFQIYFELYGLLPPPCMNCWKIVAKPKTLRELMEIHALQKTLGLPAKAGMEVRTYTSGIYSAFWYCPMKEGLEGALELYKLVNDDLSKRGIECILKRACTEMEMKYGASNMWLPNNKQQEFFDRLEKIFKVKAHDSKTIPMYYDSIKREWIEWAYQHGDETYLRYTDNKPMYAPLVTYHDRLPGGVPIEIQPFTVEVDDGAIESYLRSKNCERYSAGYVSPLEVV